MKNSYSITAICLLAFLSACEKAPTNTIAEGTVINKYTKQPIPNVPIEIMLWRYGAFGNTSIDSITGTKTGADGHFQIAFDATVKGAIYRVDFRDSKDLFDLTDYSKFNSYSIRDGAPLTIGEENQLNFEAVPFVPVRIILDADKQGAATLAADAFSNEQAGQSYFHAFTFVDTTRAARSTKADKAAYFVPNWNYDISVWRSPIPPATFGTWVRFTRFVGYNDTTVIRIR